MKPLLLLILTLLSLPVMATSWRNYTDPVGPTYEGSFSHGIPSSWDHLRVLTFNLHYSLKMPEIISWWKTNSDLLKADVILLQEVVGEPHDPLNNAARTMAQGLGMNYVFIPAFIHKENEKDFGVAILSHYPLSEIEKVILPHPHYANKTQRVSVGATVSTSSGPYRIYSFHAETLQTKKSRNDQLSEVIEASEFYSNLPRIIGGDFNSAPFWQKRSLIKHAKSLGWDESTAKVKGPTFYGLLKMRLDHIFAKGAQSFDAGKIKSGNLSDHDVLWADFQ